MKKHLFFCLLLTAGIATACQTDTPDREKAEPEQQPVEQEPAPSQVVFHRQFQSQFVPARTIRVWLPAGYCDKQRYDVLYMHDGKMLFDASRRPQISPMTSVSRNVQA